MPIATQHTPHEVEFKDVEFEIAEYGMIALQTAFSTALQSGLSLDVIVQKMAIAPREILKLEVPVIAEGQNANLVVLDTKTDWEFTRQNNRSRSYNSPFMGQNLTGKVLLTCNNNQLVES
jgi:dihydroorotase